MEMRPEGGKAIGGGGSPGGEVVDAAGSMIAAESAPCEVLDWEGTCDIRRGSGGFFCRVRAVL